MNLSNAVPRRVPHIQARRTPRRPALGPSKAVVNASSDIALEVRQPLPWTETWKNEFLAVYWQKHPVLIRGAFPDGWQSPISPDVLAGLACDEEGLPSRLYMEEGPERPWQLLEGPFDPAVFATLPDKSWQLLVNGVDREVPAVADLLTHFDFVPRWRVDDVMISYAPEAGSIGPHSDSFDVFLLQGSGRKRWSVSVTRKYAPDDPDSHVPDLDVRILSDWQPEASWELGPGDMLYVPPHFGHEGVALSAGQTLSVGFLAPQHSELVTAYAYEVASRLDDSLRFRDPDLELQEHPGQISEATVAKLRDVIQRMPTDHDALASWFGRHISQPRGLPLAEPPEAPHTLPGLRQRVLGGEQLCRNESSRMLFTNTSAGGVTFFVDGLEFATAPRGSKVEALVHRLTHRSLLDTTDAETSLDEAAWKLLLDLVNDGYMYFVSERVDPGGEAFDSDSETDSSDVDAGCMD